jgi:hypothetical protein
MLQPFVVRAENPQHPLHMDMRLIGPHSRSGRFGKEKNPCTYRNIAQALQFLATRITG